MPTINPFIFFCATAIVLGANNTSFINGISAVNDDKETGADTPSCIECHMAVIFFRSIYEQNNTRDLLIEIATFICKYFVQEESLICYGLATQFREEILYVVKELFLQPDVICSMFMEDCGSPKIDSSWNITLPAKRPGQEYPTYPTIRQDNLRILHITDLHLDSKYAPGSEASCTSELCCHVTSDTNGSTITQPSGYYGTIGKCDIPYWTVENMLQNIQKLGKIDYILVGGDYESHMDWSYTRKGHLETIRNLSTILHNYFNDTPIYWTLGNHEGVPIDSFAPHYIPDKYRPQWLYNELLQLQKPLLDKKSVESVKYHGSYAVQLQHGLKLISLNSAYCDTSNFWLYINQTDPDGILSWLVMELEKAELNGQYVHILSHIPPGNDECLESWARNYYKIIARFSKTIKAQYFGHIHVDSFTVFYENMNDDSSRPISVLYASPSVTTFKYLNPAFRIYEIQPGMNYRVVNFHTYFLNLTEAELNTTTKPVWKLLYSAKEDYGLDDLSPTSWDRLINKIIYEKATYDKFIRNSNRQDNFVCEGKCRFNLLCFLRKGHHNLKLCNHITSNDNIRRNQYTIARNPFKLRRIFNERVETKLPTVMKEQFLKTETMLLKKKLRSYIMKRVFQLLLLS